MIRNLIAALLLVTSGLMTSCSPGTGGTPAAPPAAQNGAPVSPAASLHDPKASIAYQLDLLKAGDVERLRACFTPRLRDSVTPELVEKGKNNARNVTLEDLFDKVEMGEAEGQQTAKVKMKNGRTLTTLVQTNGQWLADALWFS